MVQQSSKHLAAFALALAPMYLVSPGAIFAEASGPTSPCPPLPAPAKSLPPGHIQVVVTLPRTVDPLGCPVRLERGTLLFKTYPKRVEYLTAAPNGGQVKVVYVLDGMVESYVRTSSAVSVRMTDGRVLAFPASARITSGDSSNFRVIAVPPGERIPTGTLGAPLKPDYIVP